MATFPAVAMSEAQRMLLEEFRAGRRVALARVISTVENARPGFEALLDELYPATGGAHRVGITGPPGAGKSSLVARLVSACRARGERVGVLAVDPTSPFTGGALLGDRIRMNDLSLDEGVFIRSMATRGSLGGLATTTREVADVMDAFGFDRIFLETVGVGQTELDVAAAADTTTVVLVPESGDSIQAMKAGLMEISDVFVVNKADRPGAEKLAREVRLMLHLRAGQAFRNTPAHHGVDLRRIGASAESAAADDPAVREASWEIPVLQTVAHEGEGVEELLGTMDRHRDWLSQGGELQRRRRQRLLERVRGVVERDLRSLVWAEGAGERLLVEALPEMEAGEASPYTVAARIVRAVLG